MKPHEGVPNSPWMDTHAHLSDQKFDSDREAAISRSMEANVNFLVEIADGPTEWEKAKALSHLHPKNIWWAGGFHPYYADQVTDDQILTLKKLSEDDHFVAVGEVGLDYAKATLSKEIQKEAFEKALELAFLIEKPLVIHCRDAYADLIPLLKKILPNCPPTLKTNPGVIHCFSGNGEDAEELLQMGFFIGVDAPITYPNAHKLREALSFVPLDKIVLETDSPYLPPQPFRGQRNEPAYIPIIGQMLASQFKISEEIVRGTTLHNSFSLYRIKPLHNAR